MTMLHSVIKDIAPFMKENGFGLTKNCFFKIANDLAYCIEFEKPSGLIYVTCYIIPLYIPSEYRCFTYGSRMKNVLSTINMYDEDQPRWCSCLKTELAKTVFPLFQKVTSPNKLVETFKKGLFKKPPFPIPKIDMYRLLLFTAFYQNDAHEIEKIINKYNKALATTTYLTQCVLNNRFEEIEKIKNDIEKTEEEKSKIISDIIRKTKKNCFGL